jgi:hypothetical protein
MFLTCDLTSQHFIPQKNLWSPEQKKHTLLPKVRIMFNCLSASRNCPLHITSSTTVNQRFCLQDLKHLHRKINKKDWIFGWTSGICIMTLCLSTHLHHHNSVLFYSIPWKLVAKNQISELEHPCTGHILPNAIISLSQNWKFDWNFF